MKCPQCERWNRATLEKCFYCGAPLPQPDAQSASIWRSENSDVPKPPSTVIYSVENDDRTVPPVNSTLFYEALKRNGVKGCSLRIYPSGGHGGGFNPDRIYRTAWRADVLDWLGTLPNSASH